MNLVTDDHREYCEHEAIWKIQQLPEDFNTDQTRDEAVQDRTDNHCMKTYWIFLLSVMLHLKIMKMSSTRVLYKFIPVVNK